MEKHAINWFEIPVLDFDRAKSFYSIMYDYEMSEQMISRTRMGFLKSDLGNGGVGGAICLEESNKPSERGVQIYLNANPDLSFILDRMEPAGGKIILSKTQISLEIGYFAVYIDSEGNRINLHSNH